MTEVKRKKDFGLHTVIQELGSFLLLLHYPLILRALLLCLGFVHQMEEEREPEGCT